MKTSIIIPNWNGQILLEKNLPSVLNTDADEIIVVDDGSTDGSIKLINRKFPKIKLIENQKNLGFVTAVNNGVKKAVGDIVILLNNDVIPDLNFIQPLISHFKDDKVFAVSCNEPNYSWAWAKFENGFIAHGTGKPTQSTHSSFWASGGSAAFDKQKWIELGGMDRLYKPFYWEDIDICYRAQKRGWKILWEPKSVVEHQTSSTISKYFSHDYIDYISLRNQLIFVWKNITSNQLINQHKVAIFKKLAKGKFWRPLLGTLLKLPEIRKKRIFEKALEVISDEQVFSQSKNI